MTDRASRSYFRRTYAKNFRDTVLLIHGKDSYCENLVAQLRLQDFHVLHERSAGAGIRLASKGEPDAVVVGTTLPGISARDVCQRIRAFNRFTPIIILAANPTDTDMISVLEAGANDYISKSTSSGLLFARLRAHLRSQENAEKMGRYKLHHSWRALIDEHRRRIPLTEMEAKVLKRLFRERGRPVSRKDLLADIWGSDALVSSHALDSQIYRLRLKIEVRPSSPRLLITSREGYGLQVPETWMLSHGPSPG